MRITKTVKITKENFKDLEPHRQRIEVAKDAIKQIKLGIYVPQVEREITIKHEDRYEGKSLQKLIESREIKCEVCVKGGIFASCVVFNNKFNIGENGLSQRANGIFSEEQLNLMEVAFEQKTYGWNRENLSDSQIKKALAFGKGYKLKERMLAILNNVVNNVEGEFVP